MHTIYTQKLSALTAYVAVGIVAVTIILFALREKKKILKLLAAVLLPAAVYGILAGTILGRTSGDKHTFLLVNEYNSEFYRELFMNALLYFPLGLTLTALIGPWSIPAAFVLSLAIETWQYFAGTGLAQGTDVLMNTLGCAIGTIPYMIVKFFNRK